jgi:hypothetical protein
MNAVAHVYDGGAPQAHDGRGGRNTLIGFGIHTAASLWWAAIFELALATPARPPRRPAAVALAAVAYAVDYYVVNKRFRPGFEACLSPRAMFAVYAAFAAGFALSGPRRALVRKRQDQRKGTALPRRARQPELAAQEARQLAADR